MWVHVVWATKNRFPYITDDIESIIHAFLIKKLRREGCYVKIINGMPDHIHCLFLLTRKKPIAHVMKKVKGSSSRFINQNHLTYFPFAWQKGYAVFSVSRHHVDTTYKYILNQKEHHGGRKD